MINVLVRDKINSLDKSLLACRSRPPPPCQRKKKREEVTYESRVHVSIEKAVNERIHVTDWEIWILI